LTRLGKILTSRLVCTIRRTGKGQGDREQIPSHELVEIYMLTSCATGTGLLTCIAYQSIRLSSKDIASLDQRRLQRSINLECIAGVIQQLLKFTTSTKAQSSDDRVPLPYREMTHWTLSTDLNNNRTYARRMQPTCSRIKQCSVATGQTHPRSIYIVIAV
jgi:hypothetical protein